MLAGVDSEGVGKDSYFDYCPWDFTRRASAAQRVAQTAHQKSLVESGARLGPRCYVSSTAAVFTDVLCLGADSYIAGYAYVTGEVRAGRDCSVNPYATVRGQVTLGDGVRIGAHASLLGFNHGFAPDQPVHRQPLTSKGIVVGDDVWIGSNVVVLDGVTIGDHCVVGAGAVVTKDLAPWSIAAGNPARPLRDRRESGGSGTRPPAGDLGDAVASFAEQARAQAADVLARCWNDDTGRYSDRPGVSATVRAHCDAVEIADLLLGAPPQQMAAAEHAERLRALQDPVSGLVPELAPAGGPGTLPDPAHDGWIEDGGAEYHVLSVGYALELLGSRFTHPVHVVDRMTAGQLVARLETLPWRTGAWSAGAWVDCWATAAYRNLDLRGEASGGSGALEALFGWLGTRVDPWTGMWGAAASPTEGRLQLVNGYYRLTRGSFAQFGLPVPHAERVVDTVLAHAGDPRWFAAERQNACNVLDVAHPLWLAGRQTRHREDEVRAWAREQLAPALGRWRDGAGFGFGPAGEGGSGPGREPGLQGTEMWLAIIWLLADLVGVADRLGYRPRGVHRPEPVRSSAFTMP
ncbi:acyltransferase [Streptomyces sp. GQFP]|uniref:acyltransferase n=1 Tax=Streptomyces sp. GQFP TaxID=2907545 RepID=UPI001F40B328|nr:acyltransferase [Streptomyces sp. GQFP]UIX33403.1 acyltransferase [Streptomyces sp. GQFP]